MLGNFFKKLGIGLLDVKVYENNIEDDVDEYMIEEFVQKCGNTLDLFNVLEYRYPSSKYFINSNYTLETMYILLKDSSGRSNKILMDDMKTLKEHGVEVKSTEEYRGIINEVLQDRYKYYSMHN